MCHGKRISSRIMKRRRGQRGAAIVELALTMVLFVVIVMTLLEFGRMMWVYSTLAHVTRQTARISVVRGSLRPISPAQIHDVVAAQAPPNGLDGEIVGVYSYWNDDPAPASIERGDFLELTLTYPFQFVTGQLVSPTSSIELSSTTRMVVSN